MFLWGWPSEHNPAPLWINGQRQTLRPFHFHSHSIWLWSWITKRTGLLIVNEAPTGNVCVKIWRGIRKLYQSLCLYEGIGKHLWFWFTYATECPDKVLKIFHNLFKTLLKREIEDEPGGRNLFNLLWKATPVVLFCCVCVWGALVLSFCL